ncbi:MAG: DUF2178 domain-containing protein [Paracoccaceae bacterium]|jgi:hypothetical protein|nr:DUF2178 domain-containing protein [Paracoccaceae bacterium]MDP7184617.1 DUF2178 domain-containing protein [Paracoccaceae bacterium]
MSHEEKNTVLQIIIGIVVNIWVIQKTRGLYASGAMDQADAIQVWAETMFWVIIFAIVAGIIMAIIGTILFAIVETMITGEADQNFISDERDKMIASSGNRVTMAWTGAGFIALVAGIKFGYDPVDTMVVLMFCFSFGGLVGELVKFARYRLSI